MYGMFMPSVIREGSSTCPDPQRYGFYNITEEHNPWVCFGRKGVERSDNNNTGGVDARVLPISAAIDNILQPLLTFQGRNDCPKRQDERKYRPGKWVHRLILPTLRPEDIKIKVDGDNIIVHATHNESEDGGFFVYEVRKRVPLPVSVDRNNIRARLIHGHVLNIEGSILPRASNKQKPNVRKSDTNEARIEIKTAEGSESGTEKNSTVGVSSPVQTNENPQIEEELKQLHETEQTREGSVPNTDDEVADTEQTMPSPTLEIRPSEIDISDDDMESISSNFGRVNIDTGVEEERDIGHEPERKAEDTNTGRGQEERKSKCEIPVTLIPLDRKQSRSPTMRVMSTGNCDRDGGKYYEIRLDTGGFDPEDVSLSCRDGHLIVTAVEGSEEPGCSVHQKFQKVFKMPTGVDIMLMKGSMDDSGLLSVSAPYKFTPGTEREIPITICE